MPESLGEKLKQAREERGISISEVSEQTRISPLYLESIENDDYRTLPGGIFNKGFVKSFAKYVGVDEHEALQDYTRIISNQEPAEDESDTKTYRPEVLTDDSSGPSMIPTIIFAAIILGLMTWGILALVNYWQNSESSVAGNTSINNANIKKTEGNTNQNTNVNAKTDGNQPIPSTDEIKAEIKALTEEASVVATADGKTSSTLIQPDTPLNVDAEETLKLRYSKYQAQNLELKLNGKKVTLPAQPKSPKMQGIEFEINMDNIKDILQKGEITFEIADKANNANSNTGAKTNTAANAKPQ